MNGMAIEQGTLKAATALARTLGVKPLDIIIQAAEIAKQDGAAKVGPAHIDKIRRFCGA